MLQYSFIGNNYVSGMVVVRTIGTIFALFIMVVPRTVICIFHFLSLLCNNSQINWLKHKVPHIIILSKDTFLSKKKRRYY